jgi:hypothetical protein
MTLNPQEKIYALLGCLLPSSLDTSLLWKYRRTGDAMKRDESVPTTTPIVMTKEKAKIDFPPKNTNARRTSKVVPEVINVRLNVTFKAWLMISLNLSFRKIFIS